MGKYLAKARTGWNHSKAFTLQDFLEPRRALPSPPLLAYRWSMHDAERDRRHGTLAVEGPQLRYSRNDREIWKLPLDSLRLVGEYTTDHGPFGDDYFLVFVFGEEAFVVEAPLYANPDIYTELASSLGQPIVPGLANRTDFSDRIVWPPPLAGDRLYRYEHPRGRGLWGRLKNWAFPQVDAYFTREVLEFLDVPVQEDASRA